MNTVLSYGHRGQLYADRCVKIQMVLLNRQSYPWAEIFKFDCGGENYMNFEPDYNPVQQVGPFRDWWAVETEVTIIKRRNNGWSNVN